MCRWMGRVIRSGGDEVVMVVVVVEMEGDRDRREGCVMKSLFLGGSGRLERG